jgi:hypothetical protein
LRLRHLLPTLAPHYDLLLIDTQGARSVLLEMAVLASDVALSPVTPEILAARELRRGTLQLIEDIAPYRHLGIEPPPLHLLINRVHPVSSNAKLIQQALREVFQAKSACMCWTPTCRPSKPIPAHRRRACRCIGWSTDNLGRVAPAALETMRALAGELFPAWQERFALVTSPMIRGSRPWRAHMNWRAATSGCAPDRVRPGRVGTWCARRAATSSSRSKAARRSTPARRRATTGPSRNARAQIRRADRRPGALDASDGRMAVAELTPQDMAAKLLAAGFERNGPSPRP